MVQALRIIVSHVFVSVDARFVSARSPSKVGNRFLGPSDCSFGFSRSTNGRTAEDGEFEDPVNAWTGLTEMRIRARAWAAMYSDADGTSDFEAPRLLVVCNKSFNAPCCARVPRCDFSFERELTICKACSCAVGERDLLS